jgi:hypothetical protein
MKIISLVLLLCFSCVAATTAAVAQEVLVRPKLGVRVRGERLVITERGRARTLDLGDNVSAARIEDAEVIFKSGSGGAVYLLLDICGWSKRTQDDRQCGAGTECDLVWLKLDARWRIQDAKSARYESCWASTTSDDGYKIGGHTLTVEFDNFREDVKVKLTYDAERPERGLVVEQSPLPAAP